jgi:hypothetical protein
MAKLTPDREVSEDGPTFAGAPISHDTSVPLEARPVQGEVDISAMTRDVIARFPKIIAKLGE